MYLLLNIPCRGEGCIQDVSRQVSGPHSILPSAELGTTFGALNIWVGKARLTAEICLCHGPSGRDEMKQLYTCSSA